MAKTYISEEEICKALDYLRDKATEAAQARANRIYMEEFRKVLKSQLMREASVKESGLAISAQERDAYADQRYVKHLEAMREAIKRDEEHRFFMAAAEAKIDAWRTQESNIRAATKVAA